MGSLIIWLLAAIIYGVLCGGVYTWLSPRRIGSWRLFIRSSLWFTVVGIVIVALLMSIFKS